MTSINKKHKAKNSFIMNGGEKPNGLKLKRVQYFTKQDRNKNKKLCKEDE